MPRAKTKIPKATLIQTYIKEDLVMRQLLKRLRIGHDTLEYYLDLYKIPRRRARLGKRNPTYKGITQSGGYELIRIDGKRIQRHRYEIEKALGRKLRPQEQVHHINLVKTDNNLENFYICKSNSAHWKVHATLLSAFFKAVQKGLVYLERKTGEYKLNQSLK